MLDVPKAKGIENLYYDIEGGLENGQESKA